MLQTTCPKKNKAFSVRKIQKSVYLLPIDLGILLISRNLTKPYKSCTIINYLATYGDLSAMDNKLKIHQRHLQSLAIEMYKSRNKLRTSSV